jgi:hypothetical protein
MQILTLFSKTPAPKKKQPTCKPQSMNYYYYLANLVKTWLEFSNVCGATPTKHIMAIGLL